MGRERVRVSPAHPGNPVRLDNRARKANLVSLAHRVRAGRPVNRAIQGSPEAPARVEIRARTAKARAQLVTAADRQGPRRSVS